MDLFDSNYIEPIRKHLIQCLHKTYDSKTELKMLLAIKNFVDLRIVECPIASEEEIRNGYTDEFGVLYSYDGVKLIKGHEDLRHYVIRTGTKIICDNAFTDCTLLNAISIPDTIKIIGHSAFCRCRSLKSIHIPNSVKRLNSQCFRYCQELSQAILPELDYVSEELFVGCNLEEIEIPESVITLEKSCFASCVFKDIVIPKYVKNIENYAFYCCQKLETIKFESSFVEKIERDAFKQCDSLKRIYVPNGKKEYFVQLLPEKYADIIIEYKIDENIKKSLLEELNFAPTFTIAKEAVGTKWALSDFIKIYKNWEIVVGADSKVGIIYYGLFMDDNKKWVITKVSNKVGEYTNQAMNKAMSNLIVKVTNSQRYLLCEKWE